ncbi:UDP-N-acetylglucosamine 2-epimerase [Massilia sp. DJPM01]|uniref:UDP-N-acetylglucosamine 2-epimerase n=1 Tax=Massilia sp. DJPM01 TaxID=3024404 RepID=UPI00259E3291|nr:UDP-N-acetylglucosamine 2-epimerase [Massilia sp. DJPM01]MDM5175745.1 UDP-N-acetylglucosamine 2-epimerase [Massilia sp. DJPM01]
MKIHDPSRLQRIVAQARELGQPVYLLVIATKPCYIKLASLVKELRERAAPALMVDAGQHYDVVLTGAAQEFGYLSEIDVFLDIRGTILGRTAALATQVERLHGYLQAQSETTRFIPVVSGDTSTSGTFPVFWYLHTGIRSIHVEAGLRSLSPFAPGQPVAHETVLAQADLAWRVEPDEPFPEALDSRLTSVASSLLLAPVGRNRDSLLREGYAPAAIRMSGSLSADAVRLAGAQGGSDQLARLYPGLAGKRWLRVDLHRRENMSPARLNSVVDALCRLAGQGLPVIFILTNQFNFAQERHPEQQFRQRLERGGVHCHPLWPSYVDVIAFLRSPDCLAIYTDSGGLQEEANILGVPCMTCRYSTDRPETILDCRSNLLIPPDSAELVYRAVLHCLEQGRAGAWRDLGQSLYGEHVARTIVDHLRDSVSIQ